MIPYNEKIKCFEDVRKEYPRIFDLSLLSNIFVKECIRREDKIVRHKIKYESGRHRIRKDEIKELVEARGMYRFFYCVDHLLDQAVSIGAKGDIITLIKRCKKHGFDPWDPDAKALEAADKKIRSKLDSFLKTKGKFTVRDYEISERDTDDIQDDQGL